MRHETRPIKISKHAAKRIVYRHLVEAEVIQVVRSGSTRPDADCDFIAFGTINGRYIEAACLDLGDRILVKTAY